MAGQPGCGPSPARTGPLRSRAFAVAGRLAGSGRRLRLGLAGRWPRATQRTTAITGPQALPSG